MMIGGIGFLADLLAVWRVGDNRGKRAKGKTIAAGRVGEDLR